MSADFEVTPGAFSRWVINSLVTAVAILFNKLFFNSEF